MDLTDSTDCDLARILWDYNCLNQQNIKSDFIFLMCSYNLDVADHAYNLFLKNLAPIILISGGVAHSDDLLNTGWTKPEAHVFQNRLIELGMNSENILIEDKATNCGENIQFSKPIVEKNLPYAKTAIVTQKPYMARRALASVEKQWPEMNWHCNALIAFYEEYMKNNGEEKLINIMVGDTWRLDIYAEKGYLTSQHMPDHVNNALKILIERGYTKHINQ